MIFKEKKAMNTTTIIIGIVLFSFLPMILLPGFFSLSLLSSPASKLVNKYTCRSLMLCNSVCNPLIYCVRQRVFRKASKRLLRRQSQIGPTSKDGG